MNKNKYEKILNLLWRIPVGLFTILIGIGFAIFPFFIFILRADAIFGIPLLSAMMIGVGAYLILQGVRILIFNQEYVEDGVYRGETVYTPKRTLSYVKSETWSYFLCFVAYVALAIFDFIYCAFTTTETELVCFIIGGIACVIIAIVYFLKAGKNHTKIKEFESNNENTDTMSKIIDIINNNENTDTISKIIDIINNDENEE